MSAALLWEWFCLLITIFIVFFCQIGELIGGSQREERLEYLEGRLDELKLNRDSYWWYLDLRHYGSGLVFVLIYVTNFLNCWKLWSLSLSYCFMCYVFCVGRVVQIKIQVNCKLPVSILLVYVHGAWYSWFNLRQISICPALNLPQYCCSETNSNKLFGHTL